MPFKNILSSYENEKMLLHPIKMQCLGGSLHRNINLGSKAELLRIASASMTFRTPEGGVVKPLDGIDLSIHANEFLTLLGPSGCGKTTLS